MKLIEIATKMVANNYRPSVSEQQILLNYDKIDSNREGRLEQDIINLPDFIISKYKLHKENLDGAFDKLKQVGIFKPSGSGNVKLSDAGEIVLQQIKQTIPKDSSDNTKDSIDTDMGDMESDATTDKI